MPLTASQELPITNRTVTLNIADEVATVTLIHHGKFNAMSRVMWRQLHTAFERIEQHRDMRCVLMLGEGEFPMPRPVKIL